MLNIEISIATEEDEMPEHYGYYDCVDEAVDVLKALEKEYGEEEEE